MIDIKEALEKRASYAKEEIEVIKMDLFKAHEKTMDCIVNSKFDDGYHETKASISGKEKDKMYYVGVLSLAEDLLNIINLKLDAEEADEREFMIEMEDLERSNALPF